jgi:Protein of unknown function/AsmA-like C-terminal region
MKRRAGQAGRIIGEALHQLGRIAMLLLVLVLLAVCLLGFRLSHGPLAVPYLASQLATAVSGRGISIEVKEADLAWAGYHEGGGVPLYLRLGDVVVRNEEGVELAAVPAARLAVLPSALFGSGKPILVSGTGARFAGSSVPVSVQAAISLGPEFKLSSADLVVTLGPGRLGVGQDGMPIESGAFMLHVAPGAVLLTNGHLALAHEGSSAPQIGFSGSANLTNLWQGSVTLTADTVRANDLPAYWPPFLVPQTRQWVTTNITGGMAVDAAFALGFAAPRNLATLDLTSASGGFTGQNLTLSWLPRAMPITQLNGRFNVLDMDTALVTASSARLGGLMLSSGQLKITGMNAKNQTGQLTVGLNGTIPDTVAILNAPPLHLLAQAPAQLGRMTGGVEATVTAAIPFRQRLNFDDTDFTLDVRAELRNIALTSSISGLSLSGGSARLNATKQDLDINGTVQFAGEPAAVTMVASFKTEAGTERVTLVSRAGPLLLHRFGLDTKSTLADPIRGAAPYSMLIAGDFSGSQTLSLNADLTPVELSLPGFNWEKPAGKAGQIAVTTTLDNGDLIALKTISATAPSLNIQGQGQGNELVLSTANIGRTIAHGTLIAPSGNDAAWSVSFMGAMLDLSAFTSLKPANAPLKPSGNATSSGPPWRVSLNFQQLALAASPAPDLDGFVFTGNGMGDTLLRGQGSASNIVLKISPLPSSRHHLLLEAPDGGFLLRALDAYDGMQGGAMSVDMNYGGAAPAEGVLNLEKFRLLQAPGFTKVMQALTIYGMPAAASGPGLFFKQAVVPFSLDGQSLYLQEARAFSDSLGFTASGSIGLANGDADIDATIVPAYAVNTFLGRIPLIGRLFTAEKGGGLFAARAKITGKLTDPTVRVNPLSALTPGALRGIFGLGKDSGDNTNGHAP